MFGLFDSPEKSIYKRIPVHTHLEFAAVVSAASTALLGIDRKKQKFAIGVVASVWACNNAASGNFELRDFDYRFIQNLGINCANRLSEHELEQTEAAMAMLIDNGLIPAPMTP